MRAVSSAGSWARLLPSSPAHLGLGSSTGRNAFGAPPVLDTQPCILSQRPSWRVTDSLGGPWALDSPSSWESASVWDAASRIPRAPPWNASVTFDLFPQRPPLPNHREKLVWMASQCDSETHSSVYTSILLVSRPRGDGGVDGGIKGPPASVMHTWQLC